MSREPANKIPKLLKDNEMALLDELREQARDFLGLLRTAAEEASGRRPQVGSAL